jgi:hypothetical protein
MEDLEARNIRQMLASQKGKGTPVGPEKEPASTVLLTAEVTADDGKVLLRQQVWAGPRLPLVLDLPRPFKPGDRVRVRGARHLAVQLDPILGENLVYLPFGRLDWTVPVEAGKILPGKTPYPPGTFQSEKPRLIFRPMALAELDLYRNVAINAYDLRETVTSYPHASASSEWGNDPVYAARNAIDGGRQNDRHGGWPGQSWGPEKGEKPWWQVDFGRVVEIDKVVILLRADFPHDSYWRRATLVFSDGSRETIDLEKKAGPQIFTFRIRRTSSLRLVDLVPDQSPGWCALAEVEVWGRDRIRVAEDLAALAP